MVDLGRHAKRERYQTAWHEAGHAIMGNFCGQKVEAITIMDEGLLTLPDEEDVCGHVHFAHYEIETLAQAIDWMLISLAGEASVRVCWAMSVLDEVAMDLEEVPITELSVDDLIAAPNGSSPSQAAGYSSYESAAAAKDVRDVEALAREWTDSQLSAAALVSFARVHTADLVASPRFQHYLSRLAAALLEVGTMNGELAEDLIDRYRVIYRPTDGGTHGSNEVA